MALTIHRYAFDESYILDNTLEKIKVDYTKADLFHKEMIEQRGDGDMGNIILNFFNKDDNYGTRIGVKSEIMELLGTTEKDFDFLILADNEMGVDTENFYKSAYILETLQKIENNKTELIGNFMFAYPESIKGISEGIEFAEKAKKEGDLILFWYQ